MILKEEDVEKPSQNITKVIDTALDKGLDTKNVSSFFKISFKNTLKYDDLID